MFVSSRLWSEDVVDWKCRPVSAASVALFRFFFYNQKDMKLLQQPFKVFLLCLAFAITSLMLNGTFLQLYRLHRDQNVLNDQIKATRMQILDLDKQLKMAKDPVFIERQALDNYDLIDEHDLMFVFSDQ